MKDDDIKGIKNSFKLEKDTIEQEELEKYEALRNDLHVTQMLFDDFKEEKYEYDSDAETTEDEIGDEKEKTNCDLCNLKA